MVWHSIGMLAIPGVAYSALTEFGKSSFWFDLTAQTNAIPARTQSARKQPGGFESGEETTKKEYELKTCFNWITINLLLSLCKFRHVLEYVMHSAHQYPP